MLYVWAWMKTLGASLHRDEGATMVEYALLVALIALVVIVAIGVFSGALGNLFEREATQLDNVPAVPGG